MDADTALIYRYIRARPSLIYYEYAYSSLTIQICEEPSIMSIYSIDSDKNNYDSLGNHTRQQEELIARKLRYKYYHIANSEKEQYLNHIHDIMYMPDVIFINGSYRIACALHVFLEIDEARHVIINISIINPEYKILLKYFFVEKAGTNLTVLQKRLDVTFDMEDLEYYKNFDI
jgi:precorrin-6B methylase 2